MSQDLISVIVPVYKAAEYLAKRSLSILNQTYPNVEFIFVDDCSPDNTWQVLQEIKDAYPDKTIIIYHNEQNLGAGPTRNKGLELSSGKYVYFADADDELDSSLLQKAYDKLEAEESDLVFFAFQHIMSGKSKNYPLNKQLIEANGIEEQQKYSLDVPLAPWSKVVRRSFLNKHNITFPDIRSGQDLCWTIQLMCCASKISLINEYLYRYIETKNSVSSGKHAICMIECFNFNKKTLTTCNKYKLLHKQLFDHLINSYINYWPRIEENQKAPLATAFFLLKESKYLEKAFNDITPIAHIPIYKLLPKFTGNIRSSLKDQYHQYKKLKTLLETKSYVEKQ